MDVEQRRWWNFWLRPRERWRVRRFALVIAVTTMFAAWIGVGGPPLNPTHWIAPFGNGILHPFLNSLYADTLSRVEVVKVTPTSQQLRFPDNETFEVYRFYYRLTTELVLYFVNTFAVAMLAVTLWWLLGDRRDVPTDGETYCGNCGFMLKNLATPRCTDCGQKI